MNTTKENTKINKSVCEILENKRNSKKMKAFSKKNKIIMQ